MEVKNKTTIYYIEKYKKKLQNVVHFILRCSMQYIGHSYNMNRACINAYYSY